MKLVIKEKNKTRINKGIDWLLYMIGYTIVFIAVTSLFKSIYIDSNHLIIWSAIIVLIIYALNKTVKPILFRLTIPITGITLGLFYPCINVFILKLVDWMLGSHFEVKNILIALFVAILLSITNFIMEEIIKSIIERVKKHE
jgi:putative membrane protein